jgi:hypothetical protein
MPCRDGIALKRAMALLWIINIINMIANGGGRVRSKEEIKLDVGKAAGFGGGVFFLFDVNVVVVVVAKDNGDGEGRNQ